MKRIVSLTTLGIIVIVGLSLLGRAKDIESKEEEARVLLLNAVTALTKIGGIGAFEVPQGQVPFPRHRSNALTPDGRKEVLNEAIQNLRKAIELAPSLEETYHFLGVAYILAEENNKAIEAFETAVSMEACKESSYVYLCSLLWSERRFDKAHEIADEFLRKYPERRLQGLILQGTTYYHEGDYQNAIKKGREIIATDDQCIPGHLLLANSYYLLGDKDNAEREFQRIIKLNPEMTKEVERTRMQLESQVENGTLIGK